ncbi:MAG: putative porin, partial [bacterium]
MRRAVAGLVMAAGMGTLCMAAETGSTAAPAPAPAPKTWADSVTVKGDLRYRYETINDDAKKNANKQTYERQRDRVRARLAAEAKCNDSLKAVIGLSTGGNDPISGNQTLSDGAQKKDMKLDLAYFDYSFLGDTTANEIHGLAGKMKNPFITFNDDLSWDPDLTPEGLAMKAQTGNDFVTLYGNAGYLWLQERDSKSAGTLYAGQGAAKFQFIPEVSLTVGA